MFDALIHISVTFKNLFDDNIRHTRAVKTKSPEIMLSTLDIPAVKQGGYSQIISKEMNH